MKKTRYFVAGDPKTAKLVSEEGGYEETFFFMVNHFFPNVLQETPAACKADHLAQGMDPAFYEETARIFRVTVEEVPKSEWEEKK